MDFSKIEKDTLEQINSIKNLDELEKISMQLFACLIWVKKG